MDLVFSSVLSHAESGQITFRNLNAPAIFIQTLTAAAAELILHIVDGGLVVVRLRSRHVLHLILLILIPSTQLWQQQRPITEH